MQAAEPEGNFEGTVKATLTRGSLPPVEFVFTRKGPRLRIESTQKTEPPEPINLVELDSGRLTIVFPHNSTFVRVAAVARIPAQPLSSTPLPPDVPRPVERGAQPGPAISLPPGFPTPPAGLGNLPAPPAVLFSRRVPSRHRPQIQPCLSFLRLLQRCQRCQRCR